METDRAGFRIVGYWNAPTLVPGRLRKPSHANPGSFSHAYERAHGDAHTYTSTDRCPDGDAHTHTSADRCPDGYAHSGSDVHSDRTRGLWQRRG